MENLKIFKHKFSVLLDILFSAFLSSVQSYAVAEVAVLCFQIHV